ncbi:hypothetical protein C8R42DRAFT_641782 [Lentinula raphanica]|nr:hypothetical protein C8R42DRAFT_641782 [Lentinula raphanica]
MFRSIEQFRPKAEKLASNVAEYAPKAERTDEQDETDSEWDDSDNDEANTPPTAQIPLEYALPSANAPSRYDHLLQHLEEGIHIRALIDAHSDNSTSSIVTTVRGFAGVSITVTTFNIGPTFGCKTSLNAEKLTFLGTKRPQASKDKIYTYKS